MVALLGPIPQELIEKEKLMRTIRWRPKALNDDGILCDNIADFFGGPFFDDCGKTPTPC
jgi:serine/threonine-protein kinase SRPK3